MKKGRRPRRRPRLKLSDRAGPDQCPVPGENALFPAQIAGFLAVSRPVPVYPVFLNYVVPVQPSWREAPVQRPTPSFSICSPFSVSSAPSWSCWQATSTTTQAAFSQNSAGSSAPYFRPFRRHFRPWSKGARLPQSRRPSPPCPRNRYTSTPSCPTAWRPWKTPGPFCSAALLAPREPVLSPVPTEKARCLLSANALAPPKSQGVYCGHFSASTAR